MPEGVFSEHRRVLDATEVALSVPFLGVVDVVGAALDEGRSLLALGNGGSAVQAQHLTSELVGRFAAERPGWPAVALSADSAALTAIANDFGYAEVFRRQVEALARPGDVVVAISTSGTSRNVVLAVEAARSKGCTTVALTGAGGGDLAEVAHHLLAVPSASTPRIQEMHELLIHALVHALEQRGGSA